MAAGVSLEDVWESVWSSRKEGLEFYIPSEFSVYWGQDVEERGRKKGMEERVWESTWEEEKIDMLGKPTSRDAYFSCLIYCVLIGIRMYLNQNAKEVALQALFYVPELGNQRPTRHAYSTFELLQMLVRCRCQPCKIMLSCASIIELGLWDRREDAFDLLSRVCSRVSHLVIVEYEPGDDDSSLPVKQLSQVFRYLLEVVFCDSKRRPTVTHFKVWPDCKEFLLESLHHMADIMSSKSSCGHFTRDPYTHYSGLQVLAVTIFLIESHSDPNTDLRMIIEHQTALHTLHIVDYSHDYTQDYKDPIVVSPEHDLLMDCLGCLFWHPTFSRMMLDYFSFLHSSGDHTHAFEIIMDNFLSSPVRGQELEVSSGWNVSVERYRNADSLVFLSDPPPCTYGSLRVCKS